MSAKDVQIGGSHYKGFAIQPAEFIHRNGIGFIEGNCIKYLCRWREKGGIRDLEKVKHYIDLLIEFERGDPGGIEVSREENAELNAQVERAARLVYGNGDG